MKQIILQKDEKRMIPILLDGEQKRIDVNLAGEGSEIEVVGLVLPAGSYFDASGSIRTRVKERSLPGDNGGELIVKS